MNDLKMFYAAEARLERPGLELVTFDTNMGKIYAAAGAKLYEIDAGTMHVDDEFDLDAGDLLLLQFLTESNSVSYVSAAGEIGLLNVLSRATEGVGSITDGLAGAAWSPDQELLALVSATNVLILMTKDFDALVESPLSLANAAEAEFVNVGWGSYATQFKGSEGKRTVKEKVGEERCLAWDDRRARLCWRSDGEFFVVHFVAAASTGGGESRKFQVFSREGVLFSTIERDINVLDAPIAWKHSKALIAGAIHRLNKHEVVFFERNGLAHGSFELPFGVGEMRVRSLAWNLDSTVLCVWSERAAAVGSDPDSFVQLWTTANYHWYLKQSFEFKAAERVSALAWDPEDSYTLHLFTCQGQYVRYKLGWTVNACHPGSPDYNGSVAVTDHKMAMITPFKLKVIPPPMCLHRLEASCPLSQLVWAHFSMDALLVQADNSLGFYRYAPKQDAKRPDAFEYVSEGRVRLEIDALKRYPGSVQQVLWPRPDLVLVVADTEDGYRLVSFELARRSEDPGPRLSRRSSVKLDSAVLNAAFNARTGHLALQTPAGVVSKYELDDLRFIEQFRFPQACTTFALVSTGADELYVGLTQFFRLYANAAEICNNCSSFNVHDEYLLFTDHTNTLKFVALTKLKSAGKKLHEQEAVRAIERGGRLVITIHSDTACVLQMPRGNLETVHPRTLLVARLKADIDARRYRSAVETMRKHRVNMNILYDHDPAGFLAGMAEFVGQLDDASLINLFLTELSEEDTTLSFYRDHYQAAGVRPPRSAKTPAGGSKVGQVCAGLVEICERFDRRKYFLVVLSCYAKTKELEKALYKIIASKAENASAVDEGLRHLLYIVDVNELFDVALGTYDFELVLMVAERSQKDPKEYLPFLNELQRLEENYRKYKIDLYLKRHARALASIVKCGAERHDELLKLVDDHKLFSEALKYFKPGDELFKKVSLSFARHLTEKKYYEEAALLLYRAEIYDEALERCLKSTSWQMYLNVLGKLKLTPAAVREKTLEIVEKLRSDNRLLEVAYIQEHYLQDSEEAIAALIDGAHWFEAITSIHKHGRFDFLETSLVPALKTSQSDLLKSIEQYESRFGELRTRLAEVREEKLKRLNQEIENDLDDEFRHRDDLSVSEMSATTFDNQSNAGSTKSYASTVNSQFTNKSSSKRRKQKKGLISLKKGSPFEDLALIQELSDTISYVYRLKESVGALSKALLLYNLNELCVEVQTRYERVVDLIEASLAEIWTLPTGGSDEEAAFEAAARYMSGGAQAVVVPTDFLKLDAKYRHPPEVENKRSWKLHFYN